VVVEVVLVLEWGGGGGGGSGGQPVGAVVVAGFFVLEKISLRRAIWVAPLRRGRDVALSKELFADPMVPSVLC
jgi:hypothetical protein